MATTDSEASPVSTPQRINVGSGRPLEHLAHYSRALRVGPWVMQSGTTAIDTEGNVIGEGDVAKQVDAIVDIAVKSMGAAGGELRDVVRSRIYITDIGLADQAGRALARHFRDVRPATTLVAVNRLARPAQLIEIEFDALDGAGARAQRFDSGRPSEALYAYSRAVRMDDQIFVSGSTAMGDDGEVAHPDDLYAQTRSTLDTIAEAVEAAGGCLEDLVYTKTFVTDMARSPEQTRAKLEAFGDTRPCGTLLGVPALLTPAMLVEVEAEAVVGAHASRVDLYTGERREHGRGFARAVSVGDQVFVSGCTAMDEHGTLHGENDWARQYDRCHEAIQGALAQAGLTLDDVVRRRTFTCDGAEMNRPYGQGPAWFKDSRPVSLGCRISGLVDPRMLVEVDAYALKGAHAGIDWRTV